MPCYPLPEANSWIQSEKRQVWSQRDCNTALLLELPGLQLYDTCFCVLYKCLCALAKKNQWHWNTSLSSVSRNIKNSNNNRLEQTPPSSPTSSWIWERSLHRCTQQHLRYKEQRRWVWRLHIPLELGMNPTATEQSWWTWVCLRKVRV